MTSNSQLIYIKLLLVAAETDNKIPLNDNVLTGMMRSELGLNEVQRCLKEICANFPNLKSNKHFRYFNGFDKYTNHRTPGKTQGKPGDTLGGGHSNSNSNSNRPTSFSLKTSPHFGGCVCVRCKK